MGYQLIIAEKPDVAAKISFVLGANTRKDGYFEGSNFLVSFAAGHLLTAQNFEDYDERFSVWNIEDFPFFPDPFLYKPIEDNFKKKQLETIKKLASRSDVDLIISAFDNDREGQSISALILNHINNKKPVKRLLRNDWTPQDVREGMNNLIDNSKMLNLERAAYARSIADALLGYNLTSVATLLYGNGVLLNIGRCILAAVKLVYDRDMKIKNFKPVPKYILKADFNLKDMSYTGFYKDDKGEFKFDDDSILENIKNSINSNEAIVISKEVKPSKEKPKELHNMTSLQKYICEKYGWDANAVKKACQYLYENGYLSYPRTKSKHLTDSLKSKAQKILEVVTADFPHRDIVKFHTDKFVFDDSKVVSHPALTPTTQIPDYSKLNENQKIVYEEVKNRFISVFMPVAEYEITEIVTQLGCHKFYTKGKVLKAPGWRILYKDNCNDDKKDDEESTTELPPINLNDKVITNNLVVGQRLTTKPPHYTESTLLSALENCGREVQDEDLFLKGFEIGTSATRDEILLSIKEAGYVEVRGKSIYISNQGIKLVEVLPCKELLDVNYTGMLEKKLCDIEKGNFSYDEFLREIRDLITNSVKQMKSIKAVIGEKKEKEIIGPCPSCKRGVIYVSEKSYYCSNFKKDINPCDFAVKKENALLAKFGIDKIKNSLFKKLISGGKTILNVNYGKILILYLQKKESYWNINFEFPNEEESKELMESLGECPVCKGRVFEQLYTFECENKKSKGCKFSVYKENPLLAKYNVKKVSKSLLKQLLNLKEVQFKISPSYSIFAILKNENGTWVINFRFPSKEENLSLRESLGTCPKCKSQVYENDFSYKCEKCGFSLNKENKFFQKFKKKINKSMAKAFLKDGKALIKGLYSESKNREFDATIEMDCSGQYPQFKFLFDKK